MLESSHIPHLNAIQVVYFHLDCESLTLLSFNFLMLRILLGFGVKNLRR